LVAAGYEVVAVSRGHRDPYEAHGAWAAVKQHTIDRDATEAAGTFGEQIRTLRHRLRVWTELGRGDVDLVGVLKAYRMPLAVG
jgi:hypothetical protein